MSPVESGIVAGWGMLNLLILSAAVLTSIRVKWYEGVLTSSVKLHAMRRDRATSITLLIIIVGCDLLLLLNDAQIPGVNL